MARRSQMGRVSLVGRLWGRSLLGVYPGWLGLELLLSARKVTPVVRHIGVVHLRVP